MPTSTEPRRGRPAAATRDDVLAAALHRYLRGHRVDVQAVASELGVGRTSVYRWFGSREGLLGEVVAAAAEPLLARARAERGGHGAAALLDTFDAYNRMLAQAPALRQFLDQERDRAVRIITASTGPVHTRMVERIGALIRAEVDRGAYAPRIDVDTLAYAIVRLAEGFLFTDVGIRGDVERLREVEAAILGL